MVQFSESCKDFKIMMNASKFQVFGLKDLKHTLLAARELLANKDLHLHFGFCCILSLSMHRMMMQVNVQQSLQTLFWLFMKIKESAQTIIFAWNSNSKITTKDFIDEFANQLKKNPISMISDNLSLVVWLWEIHLGICQKFKNSRLNSF